MPHFDVPVDELREYGSATIAPNDLDAYWEEAIRGARERATPATFEPYKAEAYGPLEVFEAPKEIAVYPYSGHDVPGQHIEHQLEEFAREMS